MERPRDPMESPHIVAGLQSGRIVSTWAISGGKWKQVVIDCTGHAVLFQE